MKMNQLDELARYVAKKAVDDQTAFADTLDAFGKLITYYALLLKNTSPKTIDDGYDGPTIDRMTSKLRKVEEQDKWPNQPSRS
jgi:hypothetical protein